MFMELFDLHCDTITVCNAQHKSLRKNDLHIDLSSLPRGSRWCQVFAIFVPDDRRGEAAKAYFQDNYEFYRRQMEKNADCILPVSRYSQLQQAFAQGKFAPVLAIEGGAALAGELEMVDYVRDCGVRLLTLTWNGENELGSGSDTDKGLTEFGRKAVARMEERGIIVDVSHLNDQGFADLCRIATRPFIATHSNSRSVCDHPRNLTDAQFCEIRDRGGLVGMNYYRYFIREDGNSTDISDLTAHIRHFLSLGGENTVCLGSDFDGAEIPDYLNGLDRVENLQNALLQEGISPEVVEKIFYRNADRFFQKYL